jgi:hypothetical protein
MMSLASCPYEILTEIILHYQLDSAVDLAAAKALWSVSRQYYSLRAAFIARHNIRETHGEYITAQIRNTTVLHGIVQSDQGTADIYHGWWRVYDFGRCVEELGVFYQAGCLHILYGLDASRAYHHCIVYRLEDDPATTSPITVTYSKDIYNSNDDVPSFTRYIETKIVDGRCDASRIQPDFRARIEAGWHRPSVLRAMLAKGLLNMTKSTG